jgi:hypothetical protein
MGLHLIFPTHPKLQPTITHHVDCNFFIFQTPAPQPTLLESAIGFASCTSSLEAGRCHHNHGSSNTWKESPRHRRNRYVPFRARSKRFAFLATVANEDSKQMSLVWLLLPPREVDASQRLSHITTRIKTLHTPPSTMRKTMNSLSFLLPEHDDLPPKHRQSKTPSHPQLHDIAMLSRCPLRRLDTPSCRQANSSSD